MTTLITQREVIVRDRVPLAVGITGLTLATSDGSALPAADPGAHIDLWLPNGLVRQYSVIEHTPDGAYRIAVRREPVSRGSSAYLCEQILRGDRLAALNNPFTLHYLARSRERAALLDAQAASALSGRVAAVHWDNLEGFQEAYPAVKATRQLFTLTPRLATCAGGTAIVDLMHHWIAQQAGEDLAIEISQHLLHARPRGTHEAQLMPSELDEAPMNSQIRKVIRLMHDSVAAPLSCGELAAAVGLSKRQLERKFKQYTATSPVRYYVNLRLSMAHKLLQQTELSVSQVAAVTGFDSFEHFSRIYKVKFGCPPSGDRLQSWDAPVMRQPVPVLESEPD